MTGQPFTPPPGSKINICCRPGLSHRGPELHRAKWHVEEEVESRSVTFGALVKICTKKILVAKQFWGSGQQHTGDWQSAALLVETQSAEMLVESLLTGHRHRVYFSFTEMTNSELTQSAWEEAELPTQNRSARSRQVCRPQEETAETAVPSSPQVTLLRKHLHSVPPSTWEHLISTALLRGNQLFQMRQHFLFCWVDRSHYSWWLALIL